MAEPAAQLPAELAAPCAGPVTLPQGAMSSNRVATDWGQDRAALIDCGARKAAGQEFYARRDKGLSGVRGTTP